MPSWMLALEWAFVIATIAYALWRGDRPVRAAAVIYAVTELGVVGAETFATAAKHFYLYIDLVGFLALAALALRVPRRWLIWGGAFRLVLLGTHAGFGLDPRIEPSAYLYALNAWLMLAYAALLWGAIDARRARRAYAR